jgi:outer membrane protein assembly factor BamB
MRAILGAALTLFLVNLIPAGGQGSAFSFVHITDTHLTASGNVEPIKSLVTEINGLEPRPAFVIDTGDITEAGRPEEFANFLGATSGLSIPFYSTTGNHDVRWSPNGKEEFEKAFKKRYQSFDHKGIHFVLLDSTMLLEHWGHFDDAQLKWLEGDLKRLKKDTPVVVFFHHWVGRERPMVDNEDSLFRVVAPFNVVAMFMGHGHSDLHWKVNGIDCFMARGLYQGSYNLVEADWKELRVLRFRSDAARPASPAARREPVVVARIPIAAGPRRRIAFGWDDANIPLLTRRTALAELRADKETVRERGVKAEFAIDGGEFQMMPPDERVDPERKTAYEGRFVARFPTSGLTPGSHKLTVKMTAADGDVFRRDEVFQVEHLSGQPKREWEFETGDSVQSHVAAADDSVYVSSLDGKVYALNAVKDGKRRWAGATKGPVVSTPVVHEDLVYAGSLDRSFYAFERSSGKVRWKRDMGAPLFSTAAVAAGTVCFGGSGKIYGLDARTGSVRWTQDAAGWFQSRTATDGSTFYLGDWANTLYALDAATGNPRWTVKMGRGKTGTLGFYYSPAISSPVYSEGRVYVCTNDNTLHAVNAATGKDDWIAKAPEGRDTFGYNTPLIAGEKIYVGGLGTNGDLYALNRRNGEITWRAATGFENYDSSPIMAGKYVAIGSVKGTFSFLDPESGAVKYRYAIDPGHCFSTPAAGTGRIYFAGMSGSVFGVRIP